MKHEHEIEELVIINDTFENFNEKQFSDIEERKKEREKRDCKYDGIDIKPCSSFSYDIDNDSLMDCCEIYGFTIENHQLVRWSDLRHKDKGFVKYFANPDLKSSTGDPYLDGKKAMRKIDPTVLPEAYHPLVAACPEIIVYLEKIVLSKNFTTSREESETSTKETSTTITSGTTNSHSHGQSLGVGHEIEVSAQGGANVSMNYGMEWNNSVTLDNSDTSSINEGKGKSWNDSLNIDTSKTAFLNANIRYKNIGTAPIYECEPTLSFVLDEGENAQTIATISAKKNAVANAILPNQTYPLAGQNPLAFYTNDDFSWQSIILNYDQVQKLQEGKPFSLQITQFSGNYSNLSPDGEVQIDGQSLWKEVLPSIYGRTACITLFLENDVILRRRVAAKNLLEISQKRIPEFTVQEAIAIAFSQVKFNDDDLSFSFEDGESLQIDHALVQKHIGDSIAKFSSEKELKKMFATIIRPGMNISIKQMNTKASREKNTIAKEEQAKKLWQYLVNKNNLFYLSPYDYGRSWEEVILEKINEVKNNLKIYKKFQITNVTVSKNNLDHHIPENMPHLPWVIDFWFLKKEITSSTFEQEISYSFADLSGYPKTFPKTIVVDLEEQKLLWEFQEITSYVLSERNYFFKRHIWENYKNVLNDQNLKRSFIKELRSTYLLNNVDKLIKYDWRKLAWWTWFK